MLRIGLRVYGATDRYREPALVGVLVTVTAFEAVETHVSAGTPCPKFQSKT